MRRILGGMAILLCAAAAPVMSAAVSNGWAERTFFGDGVKASLAMPGDGATSFGFVPLRLSVSNGQSRDLHWRAVFHLVTAGMGQAETATDVVIPSGRSVERWFFVPTPTAGLNRAYNYGGNSLTVTFAGTALETKTLQFYSAGRNQMMPWAVTRSLDASVRVRIAGLKVTTKWRPTSYPMVSGSPNLMTFDPAEAAGDWRMWAGFARVIMRVDDYEALAPAARAALRNWVALGGMLYLAPLAARAPATETIGAGTIVSLARPIADQTDDASGLFARAGLFNPTSSLPTSNELSLQRGGLADQVARAKGAGDWLVGFFIGFAVLIAPVNLYVIAPNRRRHWIFLSVPVIALCAVLGLIGMIYLQDGVGGEGVRRTLVMLLPDDNQAAVFQEQVERMGLIGRSRFALDEQTIAANVPADDTNFQPNRPLRYDRTDTLASGDWFRSRARLAQHFRRLVPTRARVELVGRAADGAPIIESTISGALGEFRVLDADGTLWQADRVPTGVRTTLRRGAGHQSSLGLVGDFDTTGSPHFHDALVAPLLHGPAQPWRFIALAEASDLGPMPTLASVRWKSSAVLLTGLLGGGKTGGVR